MTAVDAEVQKMIELKRREFSFEVLPKFSKNEDIIKLENTIEQAVENYKMLLQMSKHEDAHNVKGKIRDLKFAKEHLFNVMNLDFTKPTQKLRNMAKESKIDLKDPFVLEEFKVMQELNLEDMRRMQNGQKPLSEVETKERRKQAIEVLQNKQMHENNRAAADRIW